ncbi:hypothetical protein [Prochlorococcus sp. MIT 1223]|uniref:hypothetical protein n=1 Tax=Prochlorococcus sp. MIT 1223 TaxID=3096217 RepID=UPI002A749C23|nr:hypothetical protein [Prochlorococcus sp. MIT 1223]
MKKPILPKASFTKDQFSTENVVSSSTRLKKNLHNSENSDVLISAVISSYLLTHLHHVLQRAEYGATKDGRISLASNFAQLRKVLCMDARSMEDASASGLKETSSEKFYDTKIERKVA